MIWDSVATEFTPTVRIDDPRFSNSDAGTRRIWDNRPNAVADASTDTSVDDANCCTNLVNSPTLSEAMFN